MKNKLKVPVSKALVNRIEASKQIAPELAKVEDVGSAMMQAGQEVILAVEDILARQFDFSEDDLNKFEKELETMVAITRTFERENFSVLSMNTMAQLGDIAQIREVKEMISRKKLDFTLADLKAALPKKIGDKIPVVKQLPKPKK